MLRFFGYLNLMKFKERQAQLNSVQLCRQLTIHFNKLLQSSRCSDCGRGRPTHFIFELTRARAASFRRDLALRGMQATVVIQLISLLEATAVNAWGDIYGPTLQYL